MNDNMNPGMRSNLLRILGIFGLTLCGILIGVALAIVGSRILGHFCADDLACQSGLHALLGGIAVTQALNVMVIYALIRQRRGRKRKRLCSEDTRCV